jgi:hypothetical protein
LKGLVANKSLALLLQFIDYVRGNPGGFVRFESPEGATATVKASEAAAEGGLKLAEGDQYIGVFRLLEGKLQSIVDQTHGFALLKSSL